MTPEGYIVPQQKKSTEQFSMREAVELLIRKGCRVLETVGFDGDNYVSYTFAWPGSNELFPLTPSTIHTIGYRVYSGYRVPPIDDIIEGEFIKVDGKPLLSPGE